MINFIVAAVAGLFLFGFAREYVRNRLRFVDAVKNPLAPWLVGLGVLIVAMPVAGFLPFIYGSAAIAAGAGAGLGTASGVKALRRGD